MTTTTPSPDDRLCPVCKGPQSWCEQEACVWSFGHWAHDCMGDALRCSNLGDTNTDPAAPPSNAYTRGEIRADR